MEISSQGFEKAADKLTAEQLDRPVDEVVEEIPAVVIETPVEQAPEAVVETPVVETPAEEETKVPRSRFLTMHQRAIEAEKALRQFEAEHTTQSVQAPALSDDEDLRRLYVESFGEGELTERLYKNELARLTLIEEKAADRAFKRFSEMGQQEEQVINDRVASFDRAFEELGVEEDHEFTDDEQVALLDIVEAYSPKDAEGKLLGDYLMPLDKAYEIYQLQQAPVSQAKKNERNQVASLTGAHSQGTPASGSDAEWQPGQGRRWWNKV